MWLLLQPTIVKAPPLSAIELSIMKGACSLHPLELLPAGRDLREPRLHRGKEVLSTTNSTSSSTSSSKVLCRVMRMPKLLSLRSLLNFRAITECSTWAIARRWTRSPSH